MLTVKKVFCLSLLHYFVCGNVVRNQQLSTAATHERYNFAKALPVSTTPSPDCPSGKSLHSRNDIKALIDYDYNVTSSDKKIKENYQSKAAAIRDKHLKNLTDFTVWFENQPKHLKHVLERLDKLEKEQVEPIVKIASGVLKEYPKLETSYKEKKNKTDELLKKLHRYKMICKFNNCGDQQIPEVNRTKRNVQNDMYCSSLEDLQKEITEKLDESVKKLINSTLSKLALDDKKYEEKILEIKSKLKDKGLKEFDRIMYAVLSLEDEFVHFMNDITSVKLDEAVYNIKSLELQVDEKLLQLEQAIEKFGEHCKNCGKKTQGRYVREADLQSEAKTQNMSPVSELIEIKFKEITDEIETDCKKIFNNLNTRIEKTEEESLKKFKAIENEIKTMANDEKEVLSKLKNLGLKLSFKEILELLKKLKELLKLIMDLIHKLLPV